MARRASIRIERASAALRGVMWLGLCAGCSNPPASEAAPAPSVGQAASAAGSGASATPSSNGSATAGSQAVGSTAPAAATGSAAAAGAPSQGAAGKASAIAGAGGSAAGMSSAGAPGQAMAGAVASAAGSGGHASAAGGGAVAGAGAAGGAGAPATEVKPPCLAKPSQLIVIGDSYLNWISHNFPDDFKQDFGGEYRMYAVGGASMASGGISGFIPDQLTMAIADDKDIIAGVMTGGGNDILIADATKYPGSDTCKDRMDAATDKVCQDVITNAMETAKKLMKTAGDAGMKDVIYVYYPRIPGGGFGGMNPNVILAYSLPMARDLCTQAESATAGKLRCHFLDLQPVFEGHSDWFADDGIHENAMGSAAMAKAVVKLMQEKCIAQPKSSGCCAP